MTTTQLYLHRSYFIQLQMSKLLLGDCWAYWRSQRFHGQVTIPYPAMFQIRNLVSHCDDQLVISPNCSYNWTDHVLTHNLWSAPHRSLDGSDSQRERLNGVIVNYTHSCPDLVAKDPSANPVRAIFVGFNRNTIHEDVYFSQFLFVILINIQPMYNTAIIPDVCSYKT